MLQISDTDVRRFSRRGFTRAGALSSLAFLAHTQADEPSLPFMNDRGTARACIFLHITGGPAQQETFDMKPNATGAARGEFNPIHSNVPGIDVCEWMPRTARVTQHLAVIRSMHHDQTFHGAGTHLNLTGLPHQPRNPTPEFYLDRRDAPGIGAVIRQLSGERRGLPAAVQLPYWIQQGNVGRFAGQDAGFLGRQFDPLQMFYPGKDELPGELPSSFRLPLDVDAARLDRRQQLLNSMAHDQRIEPSHSSWQRDRKRALDILHTSGAWQAFSIRDEKPETIAAYGPGKFGRSCLVARRLVEAGVRLIMVCWPGHENHFDTHGGHFPDMKNNLLPPMDQAYAALLHDLDQRGLLPETLVVWSGEFGRTPALNGNNPAGRDHWPWVYTSVLAGGGIRGGQHYGESDDQAAYPKDAPVHVSDFVATVYHALGFDRDTVVHDPLGRPHHIVAGQPLQQLF